MYLLLRYHYSLGYCAAGYEVSLKTWDQTLFSLMSGGIRTIENYWIFHYCSGALETVSAFQIFLKHLLNCVE